MMYNILQPHFFSLLPLMVVTDFSVAVVIGEDTLLKNAQANLQWYCFHTESHMSSFFEAEIHLVIPGD